MSKLLITGGTGSFGKAFLENQINNDKFEEIRIFSRDEKKQDDLRKSIDSKKVKFYIGDVRDLSSIQPAIESVDYVFHAAALKQVPSCEFFPIEAVKTNILGANNVLTLAKQENVKRLVILSTDKAAYPVNVMGMSKALMEKVMISNSRNLDSKNRIFCGTRYGNVMASRGSVIPLFINQIKSNKDITITNPEMTRFMMSLNEAVKLVYYAFENGNNGDIFVQKSPAATIETLANALISIYNSSSKIKYIGIRHGEKMYETLVTKEEMNSAKDLGKYFRISADQRDLNYDKYFSKGNNNNLEEYNSNNTNILDVDDMKNLLLTLPEIKKDIKT
ncbi:MAG: polysaccharide biosynthesis protein [Bacteroidota bacterium]|nr:polysaccharide biosynthesis protein [Bacteroidota bacterium]|tara:strand:- start:1025 stop:2023 length:999 start_codon:yes stop_codon:yes gene_type:complete